MTNDPFVRIIMKEVEVKKVANKGEFRLKGGEELSPMNEALVALMRQNLSDDEILKISKGGCDLRQLLAIDALFNAVPANKKSQLHTTVNQKDLKSSIEMAALLIADNKLSRDGKVLHCANTKYLSSSGEPLHYFMESLKYASPSAVYVDQSAIEDLEKKCSWIKLKKTVAALVISGAVVYGSWFGYSKYQHRNNPDPEQVKIDELQSKLTELQNTASTYEQDKKKLEETVLSKTEELDKTKKQLKETGEEFTSLKKKYASEKTSEKSD